MIFEPLDLQKRCKNQWFLKIFAFTSWSLLRPILDRFWLHFASPNRPKIGPETVQTSIKFPCRFCAPSRTSKNRFDGQHGPNMAPTWPPRWAQVGSKMASEPNQKRPRKRRWSLNWFWTDFGPIWNRFWIDLEPIWDRFWIDFCSILIQFSQVFQFMRVCAGKGLFSKHEASSPEQADLIRLPLETWNHFYFWRLTAQDAKLCAGNTNDIIFYIFVFIFIIPWQRAKRNFIIKTSAPVKNTFATSSFRGQKLRGRRQRR